MKKFLIFLFIIGAIVVAWKINFPSGSWRYKITVEIETPEGIKSGSTVREVRAHMNARLTPEMHSTEYKIYGEAIAINLRQRGLLFATIDQDSHRDVLYSFPGIKRGTKEAIDYYSNLKPGTMAELKKQYYPKMITFKDLGSGLIN